MRKYLNIFDQTLKKNRLKVIIKKVFRRFESKRIDRKVLTSWLNQNKIDLSKYLKKIDNELWAESKNESEKIDDMGNKKLQKLNLKLGGGANLLLLYFLVRKIKPKIVIETGVAAGFSSLSILTAMKKNNYGCLYSSDFPYFRIKNPEKYIGYIIDEKFKNWKLFIEGDDLNLPIILNQIEGKIDIFHYDSDKTFSGKKNTYELIKPYLGNKSLLIFDDIQDDGFFKVFVEKFDFNYKIFKSKGKYIGLASKDKL